MKESWFRVHTSILDSPKFERISLAARGLWVSLGALARDRESGGRLARRDGSPMDAARIAREIGYYVDEVAPLLNELVDAGLLDMDEDGTYCLHDWDEWQTCAEERERWRTYKRQKRADVPSGSNEHQPCPTTSNQFQEVPTTSNQFQEVPTTSNQFQEVPLENKNENENNIMGGTALRACPPDDDFTQIVQEAYAQAGLDPPNARTLWLGRKALAEICSGKSPPPSREELTRTAAHCLRSWRSFSWKSFAEQFEREVARLRGDLPPPNGKRSSTEHLEEPMPRYYRQIVPPPDWGGLA
jgi:hypothetical protein